MRFMEMVERRLDEAKTIGHRSNSGGLRGHSVGDAYPFIIVAQGKLDNLDWWVETPSRKKIKKFKTAKEAGDYAVKLVNSKEANRLLAR